jgi:hypothetical protein
MLSNTPLQPSEASLNQVGPLLDAARVSLDTAVAAMGGCVGD